MVCFVHSRSRPCEACRRQAALCPLYYSQTPGDWRDSGAAGTLYLPQEPRGCRVVLAASAAFCTADSTGLPQASRTVSRQTPGDWRDSGAAGTLYLPQEPRGCRVLSCGIRCILYGRLDRLAAGKSRQARGGGKRTSVTSQYGMPPPLYHTSCTFAREVRRARREMWARLLYFSQKYDIIVYMP